jgi:hypothetical protein
MPLRFYKGQPTDHIIKYAGGRVVGQGPGLAFFYWTYNTTIAAVPTNSQDSNFVFNETTSTFQAVAIQGQFTYRISNPGLASTLMNFTVDPAKNTYRSNDPERLAQRISNVIQMQTRIEIQALSLEETLRQAERIAITVLGRITEQKLLDPVGAELLNVYFVAAKPTPEVAKALEADYRETLLRRADEAIYARRAAAVQEERKIKENELSSSIALEEQRRSLIDLEGANTLQEADYRGKALVAEGQYKAQAVRTELAAYKDADPRLLLGLAMRDIGQNAEKIGNLTITPEILASLLARAPE